MSSNNFLLILLCRFNVVFDLTFVLFKFFIITIINIIFTKLYKFIITNFSTDVLNLRNNLLLHNTFYSLMLS